jgi:hypothetical protein
LIYFSPFIYLPHGALEICDASFHCSIYSRLEKLSKGPTLHPLSFLSLHLRTLYNNFSANITGQQNSPKMNLMGNITLELVSTSKDETMNIFQNGLLVGSSMLVLLAGLAIQRRLGVFLSNHDSRIINRIIQSHRVSLYVDVTLLQVYIVFF